MYNNAPASNVSDVIDYVTIASAGNATDFGNLSAARYGGGVVDSGVRAVKGAGWHGDNDEIYDIVDYITISSTGNATDFGDLTTARKYIAGMSNSKRGVFAGGQTPGNTNILDYITIASTGNAADFGDSATSSHRSGIGASDSHGGLQA